MQGLAFKQATLIGAICIAGFGSTLFSAKARAHRQSWPIEESYVTLPAPSAARYTYLGYNELAADVTWARLLVYYGSGFLGEGDFRYLGRFVKNVITLDPQFKRAYEWASYSITVTEDHRVSTKEEDILNSIEILEQAMREFPNEYEFFWLAGIRYFLDLKSDDEDKQRQYKIRGAELLELAMAKPNAPKDLASKAASFRSALGQHEQARANLMQMILTTDDVNAREKMLSSFQGLSGEGLTQELEEATNTLREMRRSHLPGVPRDLFILLEGPPPPKAIDFDKLATERDLFGAEESDSVELFY